MDKRDIVLIGGSAGSNEPLRNVVAGLPKDFPGSIFVTTHIPSTHESYLPGLDAQHPDMPRAALEAVEIDHVAPAADLAAVLTKVAKQDAGPAVSPAHSLIFKVEIAAGGRLGSELLRRFAAPAALTCPDCGGVLSEVRGQTPLRYRCPIGHAYTAEELAAKNDAVDEAIRVALRLAQEINE